MKQYEIEVYEKYSHGYYGKKKYIDLCMILSADNKKQAISFAEDLLYEKTYSEVFGEKAYYSPIFISNGDGTEKAYFPKPTDKLNINPENNYFTIKARIFKG